MKILIVSGFLGAGKTTFIKEMMKRLKREFVILENEYGSTDVDQQILQEDSSDVWNLTEGCVCCTKSADMNASVVTIDSTLSPDYLIVEPSGVGALSNVIRNLKKIEYDRIKLLQPITILNAKTFLKDFDQYGDVYQDQIKTAGKIIISQPENIDDKLYKEVADKVKDINKIAEVLSVHYTKMDDAWWNSLLKTDFDGKTLQEVDESTLGLETFAMKDCYADTPVALIWILEMILRGAFGKIIRAKGIIPTANTWVRFDIASEQCSIIGLDDDEIKKANAECVFIGHAIDRISLQWAFNKVDLEPNTQKQNKKITYKKRT